MDPISGIGLAASVIQLVHFGISTANICHQLHKRGSTNEHGDISHKASHLNQLTHSLQQSLRQATFPSTSLPKDEQDLLDLGRKCEDCAIRLQHELGKYQVSPQTSVSKVVGKTLKLSLKRTKIDRLQEQLETYRTLLETSLLHRLSQRFDAQTLHTNTHFTGLHQDLKHIIQCLAQSQTSLDLLLKGELDQTRRHLNENMDRLEKLQLSEHTRREEESWYKEVTQSLFYPEITSRQEQIDESFDGIENSYNWVFDKPPSYFRKECQWADFSQWIRFGSKIYWINGKAGSGKSTLMNYIYDHTRTNLLLKGWSVDKQLLTASFFFWNIGTHHQKTVNGLLRSLIFQLLTGYPRLISCFPRGPLHSWSEKRLLSALYTLVMQTEHPIRVCIFIDGLDEFDGPYDALADTIAQLSSQEHVKICLSSRPIANFERIFAGMPTLRLQQLTFNSINAYAHQQLSSSIKERFSLSLNDQLLLEKLLENIAYHAEGVFLWAVIAVRTLREGLQDYANLFELKLAVEGLPSGIENLYLQILHRIRPFYRRDAVRFLQIVLSHSVSCPLDLFRFCFIDAERCSNDVPLVCTKYSKDVLTERCLALRTRILSHTLGLLDVTEKGNTSLSSIYLSAKYDSFVQSEVSFHHRTVVEFLSTNMEAQRLVADTDFKEDEARLAIARGTMCALFHLAEDEHAYSSIQSNVELLFYRTLSCAFEQVQIVEKCLGTAQSRLLHSLSDYGLSFWLSHSSTDYPVSNLGCTYPKAYMIRGRWEPPVDSVGMMAEFGMLRYICEVLGLRPVETQAVQESLLDFQQHSTTERIRFPRISWVDSPMYDLNPSEYRKKLCEHLSWEPADPETRHMRCQNPNEKLVETYLLCCCDPFHREHQNYFRSAGDDSFLLVRILLQAGANPMAEYIPAPKVSVNGSKNPIETCFWESWIKGLRRIYDWYQVRVAEPFEHSVMSGFLEDTLGVPGALDSMWRTTKALLVHGADINFPLQRTTHYSYQNREFVYFNYAKGICCRLNFLVSPMFYLEFFFRGCPEFCKFAVIAKGSNKHPWRKLVGINWLKEPRSRLSRWSYIMTPEEEDPFWNAVEIWEDTGREEDKEEVHSIARGIWETARERDKAELRF